MIKTAKFINMQRFKLPKQHVTMTMNVIVFMIFVAKVEAGILVKALALETQQLDLAHGSTLIRASHVKYQ